MYWKQLSCNNIVVLTSFSHIKIDSKWKAAVIVSHKKIILFLCAENLKYSLQFTSDFLEAFFNSKWRAI